MVFVQDHLRARQVEVRRHLLGPRQIGHPVQVRADQRGLGGLGVHLLEPRDLPQGLTRGLLGHPRGVQAPAELVDVALPVLELAQLLADLLELLAQEVLALRARHLLLGLGLDAVLEGDDLDLLVQGPRDLREPRADLGGLQDELRIRHLQAQVRRHEIGQRPRLVQLEQHREDVGGQRAPRLGQAPEPVAQRADPALDQRIAWRHRRVLERHQARPDQGVVEGQLLGARAAQPLHEHLPLAVRHLASAQHLAHAAHAVQVIGPRYVRAGRRLRAQEHQLLGAHGGLDGLQGDGARHEQRHHHVREHDEVAHRHQR